MRKIADMMLVLPFLMTINKINYDDNVKEGSIVSGKYAIFQIEHTAKGLHQAWVEIFPELQSQNFGLDTSKPIIERYQVAMVNNHVCEICVPIL